MVRIAHENNLQVPVFILDEDFKIIIYRPCTDQASMNYRSTSVEVRNLINALNDEMSRKEIQQVMDLKQAGNFREN
ncbi:MAG: hypothetical protein DWP98_06990 [Bacteroidetes bacterium]|nr:MAG: hypothetical protein DWP98_06990 [Bacteroidota bacterium]MBL1143637.1 hypothetical protein [Bacteroidota bacterium]MCB0803056.1 hypothetical protein [Flavobacteriales bacterium]NOG56439.1 hypothetical protein [Bacteroidota bacterium]